jgi:hypothetical protein
MVPVCVDDEHVVSVERVGDEVNGENGNGGREGE